MLVSFFFRLRGGRTVIFKLSGFYCKTILTPVTKHLQERGLLKKLGAHCKEPIE